jgi:hypothetical protein
MPARVLESCAPTTDPSLADGIDPVCVALTMRTDPDTSWRDRVNAGLDAVTIDENFGASDGEQARCRTA